LQELHALAHAQGGGLQLERLGIVLADHQQPGAPAQGLGQRGERLQAAVHALGLEAGADLDQQQDVVGEAELGAQAGAHLRPRRRGGAGRRRCPAAGRGSAPAASRSGGKTPAAALS